MKFKKEDMVLYLPTSGPSMHGDSVMYVIDYDEKRKKYKCLDIMVYELESNQEIIYFCKESEMALVEIDSPYHEYENAADRDGFDELYYLDGMEQTLVRNAYKHFKNIY